MIRRIREFAETLGEDLAADVDPDPELLDAAAVEEDKALDMLVKHAMSGTHWLEHDPKRVWQRLSARVRGPFGGMAIEEPANMGSSMPLPQDHSTNEVYDSPNDARRHILTRLTDMAFPSR
ncbi:MAG: hypothetical protein ABIQ44_09100 [Chloroflexia bacterium]